MWMTTRVGAVHHATPRQRRAIGRSAELLGLRHIGAWATFALASFTMSMLVGHELVYALANPNSLEPVHGYMSSLAVAWRVGFAVSILLMFRRMFVQDGSVDGFLVVHGPRSVIARMAFGGAISSVMLLAQEIVERAAAGTAPTLPWTFVAAIFLVQFCAAALLFLLPSWSFAIGRELARRTRRIVQWLVRGTRSPAEVNGIGRGTDRHHDAHRADGLAWRRRALPLRGSPSAQTA